MEDLAQELLVELFRHPPTELLSRADYEVLHIALRWVSASNRRAQQDGQMTTAFNLAAEWWLRGRLSRLSPGGVPAPLVERERVRRAFERLAPEERAALVLARLGFSQKKIAALMGVSIESVREYLRRAWLKLKAGAIPDDR